MLKIRNYGKRPSLLKIYIIDNSNISSEHLNSSHLHVNSLSLPQCSVSVCLCNDDCKRKSDTAGPKHFFEIIHGRSSIDLENQKNVVNEMRIKNTN